MYSKNILEHVENLVFQLFSQNRQFLVFRAFIRSESVEEEMIMSNPTLLADESFTSKVETDELGVFSPVDEQFRKFGEFIVFGALTSRRGN